jgi:general stress protein YciG
MPFKWEIEDTPTGRRYKRVPIGQTHSSPFDYDLVTGNQVRGFALVDKERLAEISREAGKKAHQLGKAHSFSAEEAREAGRKGIRLRMERAQQARAELLAREAEEAEEEREKLGPEPERYKPEYPKPEIIVTQPKEK